MNGRRQGPRRPGGTLPAPAPRSLAMSRIGTVRGRSDTQVVTGPSAGNRALSAQ